MWNPVAILIKRGVDPEKFYVFLMDGIVVAKRRGTHGMLRIDHGKG